MRWVSLALALASLPAMGQDPRFSNKLAPYVRTPDRIMDRMLELANIKPGDTVTIHGLRAAAMPLIQAVSITDRTSGRTIVDDESGPGPGPGGSPPAPNAGEPRLAEVQARDTYAKARVTLDQAMGTTLENSHVTVEQALNGR